MGRSGMGVCVRGSCVGKGGGLWCEGVRFELYPLCCLQPLRSLARCRPICLRLSCTHHSCCCLSLLLEQLLQIKLALLTSKLMRSLPEAMLMIHQVAFAFSALPVSAFRCPRSRCHCRILHVP